MIQLDVDVFTAIGVGTLVANAFVIGSPATTADYRIIYDAATGALYYANTSLSDFRGERPLSDA